MYNREGKVRGDTRFTYTELDAETLGDKKCYPGDTRDGFQHLTVVVFFVVDTSAGFRLTKFLFIYLFFVFASLHPPTTAFPSRYLQPSPKRQKAATRKKRWLPGPSPP